MEKRLADLEQRLQSSISNIWCRTLLNQINHLSSSLSNLSPIYRSRLTREQLLASIKIIQDLNLNSTNTDVYRRALANYLLLLSIHTHKLVCGILLDHVHHLKHHLTYWKNDELNQFQVVEQLKTTFWFDQQRDDIRITEKIKYLNNQQDLLANLIGRLAYTITKLEQQEKLDLNEVMSATNELHKIVFDEVTVEYNSQSDLLDVIEVHSQILNSFDEFRSKLIEKIHLYRRPTHLKRYLPYYIGFTAIGMFIIYKVYTNKTGIYNYITTTYESLKFFLNEHLVAPLKTIYTSTFESHSSESAYENSQLNYTNSKKILEEMLEEYGRQHAGTLAQVNNVSVEEFLATLNERARNEDMNVVMKNYQQELNSPIRSALLGDLIKGILIQVQKVKVDGEGLIIQIDQLMKQNQINFSLLATIPAILIITFVFVATKNVISDRLINQRKFDLTTLREQIIRKLREVEHILIMNSETPALTINNHELIVPEFDRHAATDQKQLMTYTTFGQFLSLIYELKYFAKQLKSKRMLSKEFNDDINLLTYTQFSANQKLLIVQQIHHSYSFLVHS
ncbi:unnamed protein product [Adineta ricciae]|uniref:Uncharacterized protein n=3 Tax=Adineta ricciae TaxID=249248 RepID=A0A814FKQ3_ADIRI|nr:unnamed protein product [Adineta ricciae]